MKRSFLYLAMGLSGLLFNACTSEEIIDEGINSNSIGFEHILSKQTKAGETAVEGDLTKENLDKFIVYGYYTKANFSGTLIQCFGGEIVSLDKGSNKWEYKNTRYWVPDATYNFYAYSCADVPLDNNKGTPEMNLNAVNTQDRELKITSYQCDRNHQHDLIYARQLGLVGKAKNENGTPANSNVSFLFNHVLSKVNVQFDSEFSPEYVIRITDVEIVNMRNLGDYSPSSGWVNVTRKSENESTPIFVRLEFDANGNTCYSDDTVNGVEKPEKHAVTKSIYTIPFAYNTADVQIKFTIEVTKDNAVVMSRNMTGSFRPNWQTGYSYTYNIRLTGTTANLEPIVFETATDMNGWTNGTSTTGTDITFSTN